MFSLLSKYQDYGSFKMMKNEDLRFVCNAPNDKVGVYVVYEVKEGAKYPIYIGSSGHIKNDGNIHVRKTGKGGIYGRIVYGHQFSKEMRYISWVKKMINEGIEELEVHWFTTFDGANCADSPSYAEYYILQEFYNKYKCLPRWNLKF